MAVGSEIRDGLGNNGVGFRLKNSSKGEARAVPSLFLKTLGVLLWMKVNFSSSVYQPLTL